MLYLVYAESANYCGYGQHFVVEASCEEEAEVLVEPYIEEHFYEQDNAQIIEEYEEQGEEFDGPYGIIEWVDEFGPFHDSWGFYLDPTQSEYYTKVNLK